MEYDWERTFPFLEIDNTKIIKLFEGIIESQDIINIIPISEGCRTTNYVIETREYRKKYILKIFFSKEQNYKREIKLLSKLKENKNILVPKLYKMSSDEVIQGREYIIYEYMEGKTLGQALGEGYILKESFVRDVARCLGQIHNYKYDVAGFLDENLKVKKELPPLFSWYKDFMRDMAQKRLGQDIIDKINRVIKQNERILIKLDEDIRLVHGDFQGTNILIKDNNLAGVLDWEFVMAGHPLADIGQFFRYEEHFNNKLIDAFEEEYNKNSTYILINDWYKISKLRDLANLIQLIDTKENMPNKYANIKAIIVNILNQFD